MEEVELIYELSPMQQAMLFHTLYAPGSGVYVLQMSLRLTGPLDTDAFERAWRHVAERHAILRTAFFWKDLEKPLQVVYRQVSLPLIRESWRCAGPDERQALLERHLEADREKGFDPSEAPLMRLALIELEPGVHQLVWSLHHLLVDGWSQGRLLRELFAAYAAFAEGREPGLERAAGFRDYIAWLQRQDLGQAEAFWRRQLAGFKAPTLLAGTGEAGSRAARRRELRLTPETTAALRTMARRHRLTLNTLVQGAWALLLAQAAGREDVVFGTTVAGRPADLPGVESIVGPFINTLPVRVEVGPESRLSAWLAAIQHRQVEARRHEHAPLAEVQRWSELPGGVPLFDHLLVFENLALPGELSRPLPDLAIAEEASTTLTNYPLNLIVLPGEELGLSALHDADRFEGVEIARLLERLAGLLTAFAEDRDQRLWELPRLLPAERHQLLAEWNDAASAYPRDAGLAELFEAVARVQPDAPAVISDDGVWSWRRLDETASRLAWRLRALGVGPEVAVGIAMERSPELIAGLLAIVKAGGAYVPLDPSYPEDRLAFMLADSGTRIVLVDESTRERMASFPLTLLSLNSLPSLAPSAPVPSSAETLALVIYTSGSTGRPKGVALPQRGIVRLVRETNYLRLGPDDRMAHAANVSFDAATLEVWGALLNGAALVVIPREAVLSPSALADRLRRHQVTALFLTTALFNQIAREEPAALSRLRTVMFGGEAADPAAVARALQEGGPERLVNLYGPAETTTLATWHRVGEIGAVPIGRPVANSSAYVLDRRQDPVPPGVTGELYAGGDGLARGYLNRPDLTAERFLPHPWMEGERLYRTGDLVRQRSDGAIEFVGRVDEQVKIRGFRIEPKEIEAVLGRHPRVRDCVVLPRERGLVAYIVPDPTDDPTNPSNPTDLKSALSAFLRGKLPAYMVPSAFVLLDALPLTPNGKLDRRALPAPESPSADGSGVLSDPAEELLAGIWSEVLGLDRVGPHDDFFALGGHSLLATQVMSRIRGVLGVDLPLRALFEAPTVAGLARVVREGRASADASLIPLIRPVPRDGRELPLSFAQQRLWLIDQLEPGNPAYNIPSAVRLTGDVSPALLELIFTGILQRHEALRTTFDAEDGRPVQVIAVEARPELSVVDLASLPAAGREAPALAIAREIAALPFDLRRGPLLRLALVRLDTREHLLLVTMHHIVSDGWSMRVLLREIAALAAGSPLPALPVQYADFAVWQRGWLEGEVTAAQLDWWRRELADAPRETALPVDRPREPLQSRAGTLVPMTLPAGLASELRRIARTEGVTPFMLLAAAFQTLLHRLGGQEDVLVGTPVAGRDRIETEGLIGFFVNTLVVRGRFAAAPTFREVLEQTRETVLGAFEHQDLPFERLVEELVPERNLAITPLFQVLFTLQTSPTAPVTLPGLTLEPVLVYSEQAQFDLSLELAESGDALRGALEISRALFDPATGRRLAESFVHLLQAALATPEQRIAELPLHGEAERHQLLREWPQSGALPPGPASILPLFARWAALTPDAPAVSQEGRRLTYRELDLRSDRLAHRLRGLGVGPETPVAVPAERTPELIVAFLGILKAGGAYVPVDPAYPEERRSVMLADSGAVLLTPELLEEDKDGRDGQDEAPEDGQLAYVLYTSGSTGRPKGVMGSHGALARYVEAVRTLYGIGPGDRVLQFCSTSFDTSLEEIVAALTAGAELVLRTDAMLGSAASFLGSCRAQGVTVLSLPTAYWHEIAARVEIDNLPLPSCLRLIILGGERALPERVAAWRRQAPEIPRLLNTYGVTESTIVSTAADLATGTARGEVPIGGPIRGTEVLLLDREMATVPIGVAGELMIGGALLARGYLGRPDLTADRFVPHPFATEPGARLYRTGDLARWLPYGELEFAGRADRQVKLRGFRIELAEIEAALRSHPQIGDAVVLLHAGDRLTAWVTLQRTDQADLRSALVAWLRGKLPAYMVPSAFVPLAALPLTPNGKLDRRALPTPGDAPPDAKTLAAPADPVEELLAGIWAEVLGRESIGGRDDFFLLGGHSLLAVQVISRIRSVLGVELPLRQTFEAPTVADLARVVRSARQETTLPPIERAARDGDLPLSFAQQRLWLIDQLAPGSPAYNLPAAVRLTGEVSLPLLERIFAEIVRRHEALRTTFALRDGTPFQLIADPAPSPLPVIDLSALPKPVREAQALRLVAEEAQRDFDLQRGPLLRLTLVRLSDEEHVLLLTMHHIVSDGWSTGVLLREIAALAEAFLQGRPSPLAELPVQYADFAVWQRKWLQGEMLEAQLAAWSRRLAGAPHRLDLPTDHPRPAEPTWRGATRTIELPPDLSAAVRTLCRREGSTPFMVFLAAWSTLLGRFAGQGDVLVGSPVAGRNRREIEDLIGFFVNTLVLRADLSGNPTFVELLRQVRETALDAFAHQELPFELLVDALAVERSPAHNPLIQTMLALQNAPAGALRIPGLTLAPIEAPGTTAQLDLALTLVETAEGFTAALEAATDLFDPATAERLLDGFASLLASALAEPERPLLDASLHPRPPQPERQALPAPEHVGPRDALELQLVQIWEEALGAAAIGVRDDFFSLGGHSLLAVRVLSHIESRLGRSLSLASLLRHPTIESLAALLREEAGPLLRTPLVELSSGEGRPLFLVHPVGGEVLCYVPLARRLARPVYGLQAMEEERSLEEMAALYLRHVRETQPDGPYLLGGWSLGGAVAYEMARQLEQAGEAVERVILIDSFPPSDAWHQEVPEPVLAASFASDAKALGLLPAGLGDAELKHRFAIFAANHRAMAGYRGGPCAAPLLLIRAGEPAAGESDYGWERLAGQPVEVHELPGDHYTLIQEPRVESLAAILRELPPRNLDSGAGRPAAAPENL